MALHIYEYIEKEETFLKKSTAVNFNMLWMLDGKIPFVVGRRNHH